MGGLRLSLLVHSMLRVIKVDAKQSTCIRVRLILSINENIQEGITI